MTRDLPFTGPTMRPVDYAALREAIASPVEQQVAGVRPRWHLANHWRALQILGEPLGSAWMHDAELRSFERFYRLHVPAAIHDWFRRPERGSLPLVEPTDWELVPAGQWRAVGGAIPDASLVELCQYPMDSDDVFAAAFTGDDPPMFVRDDTDLDRLWRPLGVGFATFVLDLAAWRSSDQMFYNPETCGLSLIDTSGDLSQYAALSAVLQPAGIAGDMRWLDAGGEPVIALRRFPAETYVALHAPDQAALRQLVLAIWRPYELRRLAGDNPGLMPFLDGDTEPWTGIFAAFERPA